MHESQSYNAECKPDTKDYRSVVAWVGRGNGRHRSGITRWHEKTLDDGDTN